MNISKKKFAAILLTIAILTSAVAYAVFHVEYQIPDCTVSIAGIGITVNWLEEWWRASIIKLRKSLKEKFAERS